MCSLPGHVNWTATCLTSPPARNDLLNDLLDVMNLVAIISEGGKSKHGNTRKAAPHLLSGTEWHLLSLWLLKQLDKVVI